MVNSRKLSRNVLTFTVEPNAIEALDRLRDSYERTLGQQPLTGADQAVLVATGITLKRLTPVAAQEAIEMTNHLPQGIGVQLRSIRLQGHLSLREVEERSLRFAQEKGSQSYQVSAGWLNRLEREEHELTVNKLIALAHIYNLAIEQLIRSIYPRDAESLSLRQLSSPNASMLLTEGPLEEQAKYLLPDTLSLDQPPDETALLASENSSSLAPYRRGIIGKRDCTMNPMIPAGSIVYIDTQSRAISSSRDWKHEFQRPIYFLMTREGYVCGWCELDKNSEWLTLISHPLSPASSRQWRYRKEVESIGRVTFVAIRLTE
jgi:transcriptional regulator with XRE-family HTH domain